MADHDELHAFGTEDNKHQAARQQAEAALRESDPACREAGLDAAAHADPGAVADVLAQAGGGALAGDLGPQDDEELAAMTRTVEPGSDAPSRAGIDEDGAGGGSGADGQAR